MEIKTTKEIIEDAFERGYKINVQWVRVEDVKEMIRRINAKSWDYEDFYTYLMNELSQSNLIPDVAVGNDTVSNPDRNSDSGRDALNCPKCNSDDVFRLKGSLDWWSCKKCKYEWVNRRDTLIHHEKLRTNHTLMLDCEINWIAPSTTDWSLVSCPDCLKHRGKK
jgi:NAD-dependent SIR2 family protein deacetylase